MEKLAYLHYLKQELANRCEKNTSYSLKAFAKAMKVDVGALSRIINGKQPLSKKMADKVIEHLNLNPSEQYEFLASINNSPKQIYAGQDLSIEYYRIIADWYHAALMELTYVENFKPEPAYISKQLKISQTEARLALERLKELGLLEEKNGKLVKINKSLSTTDRHLSTSALRKSQKQYLEKAIYSLENDSIENRNNTNMVMAIDTSKLLMAKQMIREFQMKLCEVLESGDQNRVYNLSIALFPVQEDEND